MTGRHTKIKERLNKTQGRRSKTREPKKLKGTLPRLKLEGNPEPRIFDTQNLTYFRERRRVVKAKKELMEKWESFKAKMVEHKKTLQERRGVLVGLETSMVQRETEVSSVDLSFQILISKSSALHDNLIVKMIKLIIKS